MIKNNFIAITGGPGAGKTTLLDSLARKGYEYVGETAREVIKKRNAQGLSPRPDPAEFTQLLFDADLKNYLDNIDKDNTLFFDRSFLDSAAMIVDSGNIFNVNLKEILATNRFNKTVFIAPPWEEIFCNDGERDQTYQDAVAIYDKLYHWYDLNGYTLLELPKSSVDSRGAFILGNIHQFQ